MLHYMQMRNWFIIFMILTMTYMVHQKLNQFNRSSPLMMQARAQSFVTSIFK